MAAPEVNIDNRKLDGPNVTAGVVMVGGTVAASGADFLSLDIPVDDSIVHKVGDFFAQTGDGLVETAAGVGLGIGIGLGAAALAGRKRGDKFNQYGAMITASGVSGVIGGLLALHNADGSAQGYVAVATRAVVDGAAGFYGARGASTDVRPAH